MGNLNYSLYSKIMSHLTCDLCFNICLSFKLMPKCVISLKKVLLEKENELPS